MGWERPLTHRQFLTWLSWLDQEMNNPSRTDHYLMMIAQQVYYARATNLLKTPPEQDLDKFKIRFKRTDPTPPMTAKEQEEWAQTVWSIKLNAPSPDQIGLPAPE